MSVEERTAEATVQIVGEGSGSGFRFLAPDLIVTNQHVVGTAVHSARARTEDGIEAPLHYVAGSPEDELDFAIYRAEGLPNHPPLVPSDRDEVPRGLEVVFAGFPHGIEDLLAQ